jgi:hypothetical protein
LKAQHVWRRLAQKAAKGPSFAEHRTDAVDVPTHDPHREKIYNAKPVTASGLAGQKSEGVHALPMCALFTVLDSRGRLAAICRCGHYYE